MRTRDWAPSPLGPPADWPEELRAVVALLLLSKFPMFVAWGEQLTLIYNDAYIEILGDKHPAALGAPFYEIWPPMGASDESPRLAAALAGEASYAENQAARVDRGAADERAWFTFSYSPVRDRSGTIRGVFCAVTETTEQMRDRERQAFRLRLEQRLRDQTDPTEILLLAAELLGQELGVGRVGYGSIDARDETLIIERDWTDNRIPTAVGRHPLAEFGAESLATLKAGGILAIDDVFDHPFIGDRADIFRALQIRSLLAVPLIKAGRFTALLFLHDPEPRHWSEADQALVGEVGDRTWAAVERARAQAELRRSETRFRALATTGDSMVYRVSADWRHLLDFDRDDFVPPNTRAEQEWGTGHVHPDDVAMREATIKRAIETREMLEIELRVQGKDGNWRWLRSRAVPIFDEQGEVVEWFGAATDITDRHTAEDRLRENEEQLRLATEAAEIALWDIDPDRQELLWPARMKAMFGIAADEPVTIADFYNGLHEEERDRLMEAYAATTDPKRRAPYDVEHRAIGRDGVVRWLAGKGRAIFVGDRCVRVVGTAIDITQRKAAEEALKDVNETLAVRIAEALEERAQAEEALRQAQKMEAVGRLVGGIAHDFNNLLGAVVGSLELIRHRSGDPERVKRYVDVGMQAADRGAKLTGQLLAFSRSQRIELKPIAAAKLIGSIRSLLSSTLGPMIELRLMLEAPDQRVLSDATQLEMGLINLAINARDAMPEGGRATITTRIRSIAEHHELAAGDYLEIRMEDTGCGMTPEVASRALDPFFTTKDIGKGTGLGLSQVYGIARQAGGTVQIETEVGHGTAVGILLPCVEGEPTTASGWYQEIPERKPAPPGRVLVIDDDTDMLRVISDSLEMLGYSVAEANNGLSGLRMFDELAPDLLIVDFAMPGMNGAEVAKAVRERRPDMPIIFASGYSDTEAIERVIGADAKLLRKPFGIEELKAAVMAAL